MGVGMGRAQAEPGPSGHIVGIASTARAGGGDSPGPDKLYSASGAPRRSPWWPVRRTTQQALTSRLSAAGPSPLPSRLDLRLPHQLHPVDLIPARDAVGAERHLHPVTPPPPRLILQHHL